MDPTEYYERKAEKRRKETKKWIKDELRSEFGSLIDYFEGDRVAGEASALGKKHYQKLNDFLAELETSFENLFQKFYGNE